MFYGEWVGAMFYGEWVGAMFYGEWVDISEIQPGSALHFVDVISNLTASLSQLQQSNDEGLYIPIYRRAKWDYTVVSPISSPHPSRQD